MIPEEIVKEVQRIRDTFLGALNRMEDCQSLQMMWPGGSIPREKWDQVKATLENPRFQRPCDGRIVCAIIGSSSNGKTSMLDELFPRLADRGWLVTESTDTTSQALRIEYAPADSAQSGQIVVQSWSSKELKKLAESAERLSRQQGIKFSYPSDPSDHVLIDATEAKFDYMQSFKFPLKIALWPFQAPYHVPPDKASDETFIRRLTTKELSDRIKTDPVMEIEGRRYDALQLRAVVKDVKLHDSFEQIVRWAARPLNGENEKTAASSQLVTNLVFVDTPGLGTAPSVKDEALQFMLGRKSQQIVMQLLDDDDLDIVLHVVLCGKQTAFQKLWEDIDVERGRAEIEELVSDRLIVVMNGTNVLFTDPNIENKWRAGAQGDPFAIVIRDNVIEKMPKGVRPADIVFTDSVRYLAKGDRNEYARKYQEYEVKLRNALNPGGTGYQSLQALTMLPAFSENITALCDPDDRGQGYLIRRITDLVEKKGTPRFLQRHLYRNELLPQLREARRLLATCFDDSGSIRGEALRGSVRNCLGFLRDHDPDRGEIIAGLEAFASAEIDQIIRNLPIEAAPGRRADRSLDAAWFAQFFKSHNERKIGADVESSSDTALYDSLWIETKVGSLDDILWVAEAFRAMCEGVQRLVMVHAKKANVPEPIQEQFRSLFWETAFGWGQRWGYFESRVRHPKEREDGRKMKQLFPGMSLG